MKHIKSLNEYFNAPKALEDKNSLYYKELIPGSGNAGTIEGEMLRAINKIIYRHENDGDYFHMGYGTETAGPSATFLLKSRNIDKGLRRDLAKVINSMDGDSNDTSYGKKAYLILKLILDYIENKDGEYTKTKEDMYDHKSDWQDDEEDDYEEDEEDDDYY